MPPLLTSTNAPVFDYYACTVRLPEMHVLKTFVTAVADEAPVPVRPAKGYGHAWELRRSGRRFALVSGGGQHEFPHVVGSGPCAPTIARLARSMPHRVSRVDVCVDTEVPGAYATLRAGLLRAAGRRVSTREISSPSDPTAGRTLYVGSTDSEHMARLYEKGKQLPSENRPDWVRYELQLTPEKGRKDWAATASPLDLLGGARWARSFASASLGLDPDKPPVRTERVSDLDGSLNASAVQYGARWLESLALHGGDVEAWALDLLRRIPTTVQAVEDLLPPMTAGEAWASAGPL